MSIDTSPLVTVITVVYNNAKTLEQTILSVIEQSYKNVEYIIIDGGSTDGSVEIIQKYARFLSHWESEPDQGLYFAMNKALKRASGAFIAIINSDDWYEPNALAQIVDAAIQFPETDVFHGLLRFIDLQQNEEMIRGHYDSFLSKGMIEHPTCFVKKTIYDRVGFFDTRYQSAADYDWMIRVKKSGAKFRLLPAVLSNFRRGGMSESLLGALEEVNIKRKHGYLSTTSYWYKKVYIFVLRIIRRRK
ncbi:MAG: glycosyltransferase family 2 protein [Pedobacter agri]